MMMGKNMPMMTNLITKNLLHWQECFLLGSWPPGNDYEESNIVFFWLGYNYYHIILFFLSCGLVWMLQTQ